MEEEMKLAWKIWNKFSWFAHDRADWGNLIAAYAPVRATERESERVHCV